MFAGLEFGFIGVVFVLFVVDGGRLQGDKSTRTTLRKRIVRETCTIKKREIFTVEQDRFIPQDSVIWVHVRKTNDWAVGPGPSSRTGNCGYSSTRKNIIAAALHAVSCLRTWDLGGLTCIFCAGKQSRLCAVILPRLLI